MLNALWGLLLRHPARRTRRQRRLQKRGRWRPVLEALEARDLPALLQPLHVFLSPIGSAAPQATAGPTGTTPTQIRHAYGFDQISFSNGTVPADSNSLEPLFQTSAPDQVPA